MRDKSSKEHLDFERKQNQMKTWIEEHIELNPESSIKSFIFSDIYNEDNKGDYYAYEWFLKLLEKMYPVITHKESIVYGCKFKDNINVTTYYNKLNILRYTHIHNDTNLIIIDSLASIFNEENQNE